jgi:hypothetical protein
LILLFFIIADGLKLVGRLFLIIISFGMLGLGVLEGVWGVDRFRGRAELETDAESAEDAALKTVRSIEV